MPGNPDNINRASDGNYWLALVGIRTPSFDLAMRKAGFRLRMVKQVPTDEWLAPALNHGCVLKFNEAGNVLKSYWDPTGISHSTLTSMREHKGYLYLGGLENNRIGRIKLDPAHRRDLDRLRRLLGQQAASVMAMGFLTICCRDIEQILFKDRDQNAIPSMDGAFSPNDRLEQRSADRRAASRRRRGRRSPGRRASMFPPANKVWRLARRRATRDRAVVAEFDGDVGALAFHPDGRLLACTERGLAAMDAAGRRSRARRSRKAKRCNASRRSPSPPTARIFAATAARAIPPATGASI